MECIKLDLAWMLKSRGRIKLTYLHHGRNPISSTTGVDANDSCMWMCSNSVPQPEMITNAYKKS